MPSILQAMLCPSDDHAGALSDARRNIDAWIAELAGTVGVPVPLYAAEHVHVSTEPIEGAHDLLPLVRGLDGSFYARHHAGGLMIGAFEPNGRPRSTASIPDEWAFGEFGPDWEHFAPTRANATRRIPALEEAEFTRFLRAPESFTPDVNFCLGQTAEVRNLFVAAGFNSQGIIYSPGAGRALAEWIAERAPDGRRRGSRRSCPSNL